MPDLEKLTLLEPAELAQVSPALARVLVDSTDELVPVVFNSAC